MRIPISIILLGVMALAALYLTGLGAYGLIETTDARYVSIAAAMHDTGDWTIPRIDGFVHLHKPPLVYWCGALGMKVFGRNELGARLPQVLLVALTLALLGLTFARLTDRTTGILAVWMAGTSLLVVAGARGLNTDILVLVTVTAALCGRLLYRREGLARWNLLFWTGLAFAMLAKGPVPVAVVTLILAADRILPGVRLPVRPVGWLYGLPLFLAVNLPWYGFVLQSLPGLLDYFIHDQLLSRVGGSGEGHPRPLLFFLYVFPLAAFPWSVFFLDRELRGRDFYREPLHRFLLIWLLVPLLFFSLPKTKLPLYVIPAIPALAALVACRFSAALSPGARVLSRGTVEFLLGIGGVLCVGLVGYGTWRQPQTPALTDACLRVALLLLPVWALLAQGRRRDQALSIVAGAGLLTVALVAGAFWRIGDLEAPGLQIQRPGARVFALRTVRPLARAMARMTGNGESTLIQYGGFQAGFSFYLPRPAFFCGYERNLRFDPPQAAARLIPDLETLQARLPTFPAPRFLVAPRGEEEKLTPLGGTLLHRDRHLLLLQLP